MAEARSEEEEENTMRDNREQVVRRQPNSAGGRPDRRKPEHRHSQGPLSSIRAAIKRTSTRPTSLSESSRERERDRRRPEITILSAEPLASTSWFPGASGGFPPPPPPAAQIWGSTIPPSVQPPPSYEEVIREKTQEQVLLPSSSPGPATSITIATQTDPGSAPDHQDSQVRRPVRPPRPRLIHPPKPSNVDDIIATSSQSKLDSVNGDDTRCCDILTELCSPLTSNSGAQTDQWERSFCPVDVATAPSTSSQIPSERPRPRPRSRLSAPPLSSEVKVQTLVKLREDGLATLAARTGANAANQEVSQGKYLQELLEAFSADDWGFPDRRSNSSSGNSQSESEEEEEDMATLRARIQAFEQQVADGSSGETSSAPLCANAKKPEPRPRPRLQATKSAPPTIAPKPKTFSQATKPSTKVTADSESLDSSETPTADLDPKTSAPPLTSKPAPSLVPQPCRNPEKPSVTPKPQSTPESLPSGTHVPVPVPAPRPPPPKITASDQQTKPPPRPSVAPRASVGAPTQDKSTSAGHATPTLPPRPPVEASGGAQTPDSPIQTVKVESVRPGVPAKPAALTSLRRSSAPNLAPKPSAASPTASDTDPVPPRPSAAAPATAPKPAGPPLGLKPATTAPAPALRKGPIIPNKPETTTNSSDAPLPPRPSGVKLLPLRPPPIKSTPGRPPPPAITSTSSSTLLTPPTSKSVPALSASTAGQSSSSQTAPSPSSVSANQIQSKLSKKGPPLPPRPKPGHPLYNSNTKQEVLIVLDDPSPSEPPPGEGRSQTSFSPLINQSQCLLDLDDQPELVPKQESQSKPALADLNLLDSESILPVAPAEQKERPDPPPVSGPRCVALFDYEGEEEDELTFSQGDVIALLELIGQEWGRGQIHGRIGIFPLSFTEVVEPPPPQQEETTKSTSEDSTVGEKTESVTSQQPEVKEWAMALFDFPGQTAEDLSFHKGALIEVTEHVDAEWNRGRVEGREGLYPAAFTHTCSAQPITEQQSALRAVAKFDFTAESEDELTLKIGDIITQVELVDEQWILGVAGGKRGIVPKNYISLL